MRTTACLVCALLFAGCGIGVTDPGALEQCLGCASDGYDDPAGSGYVFLVDDYLPTPDQQLDWALDIDGDGDPDQALNVLSEQYQLLGYDFSEFVRSGAMLGLFEIAGIEQPYAGEDDAATLKIYKTKDADGDYSNNACQGDGCGQFMATPDYIEDGQTIFRLGPGPIVDHRFRYSTDEVQELLIDVGEDMQLPFYKVRFEVVLPDTLDSIPAGVACGAVPAWAADSIPMCSISGGTGVDTEVCAEDSTLAFVVARLGAQPDIDLDGDGLETYDIDFSGNVVRCHDGDGSVIEGAGCLRDPRITDGYSICASFRGIPAEILLP